MTRAPVPRVFKVPFLKMQVENLSESANFCEVTRRHMPEESTVFTGALVKSRKAAVSFVISVRSICPHATTRLPLEGFDEI